MDPLTYRRGRAFFGSQFVRLVFGVVCFVSLNSTLVLADLFTYNNSANFNTAIAGRAATTINFDVNAGGAPIADGTVLPNNSFFQGIRFDPNNSVTGDLIVTNGSVAFSPGLKTFSGLNYLGSSVGDVIKQSFVFQFQLPVTSVGLYIISPSELLSNEVGISVGTTSSLISSTTVIDLGPTAGSLTRSFAYFIGIVESNPALTFTNLTVNPNLSGVVDGIGIDNITFTAVPEPTSLLSICMAALVAVFFRRKRVLAYATVRRT
ncbi:MAG: PEP-CTERM sorting domain-containing protein [Pirellula sp.]